MQLAESRSQSVNILGEQLTFPIRQIGRGKFDGAADIDSSLAHGGLGWLPAYWVYCLYFAIVGLVRRSPSYVLR